jgi:hypothetical protein
MRRKTKRRGLSISLCRLWELQLRKMKRKLDICRWEGPLIWMSCSKLKHMENLPPELLPPIQKFLSPLPPPQQHALSHSPKKHHCPSPSPKLTNQPKSILSTTPLASSPTRNGKTAHMRRLAQRWSTRSRKYFPRPGTAMVPLQSRIR